MTEMYAIANQKGGVGKTTTAINLAATLTLAGKRVLLVDLDPQGNATSGSGVRKNELKRTVVDVLLRRENIAKCIIKSPSGNYDILPTNDKLASIEISLNNQLDHEYCLHNALSQQPLRYHYILFDCPPALSILTINGLTATHYVLVPIQCEYYALEGLSSLRDTISRIRATTNPSLRIAGILRTMYDSRNNLAKDVSDELIRHFHTAVYQTIVPRNVTLAEAPSHGLPAVLYDRKSSGARAYIRLAGEILRHDKARMTAANNDSIAR